MSRSSIYLAVTLAFFATIFAWAQDDGPPISITSPDKGTTYAYADIKNHALIWNKKDKVLIARITFVERNNDLGQSGEDTHDFRFPGVMFDEKKGVFTSTTAKGEVIPIAHYKKTLFIKSIDVLPNANIRILHPRGVITVVLEAISPDDPAMRPPPDNSDPDATHQVDVRQILN